MILKIKIIILLNIVFFCIYSIGASQESPHKEMEMDCQRCHTQKNWKEIHFDHSTTPFPLDGQHQNVKCKNCHYLENFKQLNHQCVTCHTDVHQSKLGNWCAQCHTPVSWTIIDIEKAHANTTFPITGAHARLDCDACHYTEIEGKFSTPSSECYSCHGADFRSVTNPNHLDAAFSRRCELCHTMFAWRPAEFEQHDVLFPIFSGEHAGEWQSCRTCHFNPGNYTEFTCLNCHEHNRQEMDDEHREVAGYSYHSNACYSCHPTGSEGEGND